MLSGSKFRLRRKVWSKSCAELALLPEAGAGRTADTWGGGACRLGIVGSAYKICLSPKADGKTRVDQPAGRGGLVSAGWRRKSDSNLRLRCGHEYSRMGSGYETSGMGSGYETSRESLESGYGDSTTSTLLETAMPSPAECSRHHPEGQSLRPSCFQSDELSGGHAGRIPGAHSPKRTYSCRAKPRSATLRQRSFWSRASFSVGSAKPPRRESTRRQKDNVVHWKVKVWKCVSELCMTVHAQRSVHAALHVAVYSVQCAVWQCTVYSVAVYSVQCTVWQCTVYSVQCTVWLCTVWQCTVYSVQCTVWQCTVYSVQCGCVQCGSVQCTVYSVQCGR